MAVLSLKDVRKTDLWNWVFESQLCLEFISAIPSPGPFLRAAVINCLLNWRCQSALAGKLLLQEISTRWQHFFMPNSGSTCNQSLRESPVAVLWFRVECAGANTQGLISHYFLPSEASPLPPLASCLPGALLPTEVPRGLHSQEGVLSWGSQETWDQSDFLCSSKS